MDDEAAFDFADEDTAFVASTTVDSDCKPEIIKEWGDAKSVAPPAPPPTTNATRTKPTNVTDDDLYLDDCALPL